MRGWVIGAVAAALLIVAARAARHLPPTRTAASASARPLNASCQSLCQPVPPLGPDGEAVTDSYYFVHRTLAGDGSITARVTSLTGLYPGRQRHAGQRRPTRPARWSGAAVVQGRLILTTARHRLGVRRGDGHRRARRADAVRLHPRHRRPAGVSARAPRWLRLTRAGDTLTGYESADGTHWTQIGTATSPGCRTTVQVGLFVTSPQTAPASAVLRPVATARPPARPPTLRSACPQGAWTPGGWAAQNVGANVADAALPTLSSVGSSGPARGFTVTGSGDIAPASVGRRRAPIKTPSSARSPG